MEQPVVLVTGASSGFGKAAAELLASERMTVYGTSRRTTGERVDGYKLVQLDVDSDESVSHCVTSVVGEASRIDVLVNNAGQASLGAVEETSISEAKSLFETNFFGAVRMTNAVLPTMRRQRKGLIINVASLAAMIGIPCRSFYCASKAALSIFSEVLRYEVSGFGIHVTTIYPGFFRTGILEAVRLPERPVEEYREMRDTIARVRATDLESGDDPKLVAETIRRVIRAESPRAGYVVGKGRRSLVAKKLLPRSSFESLVRKHYRLNSS